MLVVYRHTCKVNGKAYIGVSKHSMERRWYHHCYGAEAKNSKEKPVFHRAIKKHGKESFISEIIFCPFTIEDMLWAEAHLVEQHKTMAPNGYNSRAGGEGYTIVSDDYREYSSRASKEMWEADRPKMISALKRRWENPSYRKIKSDQVSGNKNPMYGTAPWDNPKTQLNLDSIIVWALAPMVHEFIKKNGYMAPETVCKRLHCAFGRVATIRNMIKMFKRGWIPREDPSWVSFSTTMYEKYRNHPQAPKSANTHSASRQATQAG